jgi:hypothetical protein
LQPATLAEIESLVQAFEACTLPRSQWTHAAHLTVAFWYLVKSPRPEASDRIRGGIQRYNHSVGIQTTKDSGYHETLTLFWIHIVHRFITEEAIQSFTPNKLRRLIEQYGDPQLPLRYYSRDRLFSWEARLNWLDPDLQSLL